MDTKMTETERTYRDIMSSWRIEPVAEHALDCATWDRQYRDRQAEAAARFGASVTLDGRACR